MLWHCWHIIDYVSLFFTIEKQWVKIGFIYCKITCYLTHHPVIQNPWNKLGVQSNYVLFITMLFHVFNNLSLCIFNTHHNWGAVKPGFINCKISCRHHYFQRKWKGSFPNSAVERVTKEIWMRWLPFAVVLNAQKFRCPTVVVSC